MTATKGRADHIDHLVSKRLKMRRMILGLSQHELGEAVDVSIQQVQKYEKATNRISCGRLHGFSKVLKVPINYFFDQNDDSNNTISSVFSEDGEEYQGQNKATQVTEKEVISLIRAFGDVKNSQIRKKILELVKSMV